MANDAVFRVEGLRKSFGLNQVLRGVGLDLRAGEVTVLMGANGAGKSTLVKIISGAEHSYGGTMTLDGTGFAPATPAEAIRAGVVTVHQNINDGVVAALDVATNLTLDRLSGAGAPLLFNPRRVRREAQAVAARLGLDIDLRADIASLSLADRQMVAIARAMAHEPKVLILDEPTSSLSSTEANRLFTLIDRLRERGVAILFISHRMSDIRRLADRIVFAARRRHHRHVFANSPLDYEGAVTAMLGQTVRGNTIAARAAETVVFQAEDLAIAGRRAADRAHARRRRDRGDHGSRRRRQDRARRNPVRGAAAARRLDDPQGPALCAAQCARRHRGRRVPGGEGPRRERHRSRLQSL